LISGCNITLNIDTKSETEFEIGPTEAGMNGEEQYPFLSTLLLPYKLVLPGVGLNAFMPVKAAGILKLPPKSDPRAIGTHLAATNPASPPELPPHDLSL
jgi:hypothetical protein